MIAWWPNTILPGESDHPSAFWDWLPTACELAGIDSPNGLDGVSFAPTLLGKTEMQAKHDYLFWRWSRFRAVRMGKWKALQTDGKLALYDLSEDLGENAGFGIPESILGEQDQQDYRGIGVVFSVSSIGSSFEEGANVFADSFADLNAEPTVGRDTSKAWFSL